MNEEVQMIPIERIRILNPRQRDRKKFELIVQSIKNLGLKKPIQVSWRGTDEAEGAGYDLVCGQGRIEAYTALGHREIPALVVELPKEERLLRSLVENMARRNAGPMEFIREIERLTAAGYTMAQVATKLDASEGTVKGMMALRNAGEERLLEAAVAGRIPLWVAIEIAKTEGREAQRALLKAVEAKQLTYLSLRAVKKLIDQRRCYGKRRGIGNRPRRTVRTSADGLMSAYRRESQRQKLMLRKAKICEGRLTFLVTALDRLLSDAHFVTLLRAEGLATMPKYIWEKLGPKHTEAG